MAFRRRRARVADRIGASMLPTRGREIFGWADRPVAEIIEFTQQLQAIHEDPSMKFAMDFRPHDDHHRLMTIAWESPTESATIDVGETEVTGYFTTWSDGAFPVFRDLAANGSTCRFRVELAST